MKAVIDINVWISGFLWGGTPEKILHLLYDHKIDSYVSGELLQELEITLQKTKFKDKLIQKRHTVEGLLAVVNTTSKTVRAVNREVTNLRDPDDAKVIAVAIAAQSQAIITGDLDLLVLQSIQGIESSILPNS